MVEGWWIVRGWKKKPSSTFQCPVEEAQLNIHHTMVGSGGKCLWNSLGGFSSCRGEVNTSAKNFSWFYDCPGPPPGSMITDNAPGHPWTTPGPLLFTKSWRRSAKVVQSGSRWSTVVQSGPGRTRRQKQLFNFFADAGTL